MKFQPLEKDDEDFWALICDYGSVDHTKAKEAYEGLRDVFVWCEERFDSGKFMVYVHNDEINFMALTPEGQLDIATTTSDFQLFVQFDVEADAMEFAKEWGDLGI